jgi:putative membrane protein
MKRLTILALVGGLLLASALIVASGASDVAAAVASVGFGIVVVCAIRTGIVTLTGTAWWLLFPAALRPRLRECLLIRLVREGANNLLPVAQVGGEVIGGRLLVLGGMSRALAGAGILADMLAQVGTQFLFTLAGLVALLAIGGDPRIAATVAVGLAVAVPLLGGFYLAQRAGRGMVHRLAGRLLGGRLAIARAAIDRLYERLHDIYGNRAGLAAGTAMHFLAWLLGTLEVWVALAFMGHPVSLMDALVIESLAQAVRGAAFVVPGGIGVQEGGLIALCAVFGIPAEQALALSLVKRVADLVLGLPGLAAWQFIEGRRLFGNRSEPDGGLLGGAAE